MINLVLLGPPASGKGTQAKKLVEQLGLTHLSAGDLLRDEIARQTPLGLSIKDTVENGRLVTDDVVIELFARRIEAPDCAQGVLFDGFPRTLFQAQALDDLLNARGTPLSLAIELQADEGILLARMQMRIDSALAQGQAPRKDDNIQTLQQRLRIYRDETMLAVPYYAQQGKHEPIDAVRDADAVCQSIGIALQAHGYMTVPSAVQNTTHNHNHEEPKP